LEKEEMKKVANDQVVEYFMALQSGYTKSIKGILAM
jgi:hypothetical protein